ncbi:MAG: TetR/AcrR family transcriptional regulator [Actinobacteria bacterium]|nr:TetR/AcrR family transcriptional regulator [Actinomycetota bacterium]
MPDAKVLSTRARLLASGAAVFAEKGYEGGSTREICQRADTSINMVHHYFGTKANLLEAIIDQFGVQVLALPMKLLATPPKSRDDFISRIELLFHATLEACLEHRPLLMVVVREQAAPPALGEYIENFTRFLTEGKHRGFVRKGLDTTMITGAIIDRIISQVLHRPSIEGVYGIDMSDPKYLMHWCTSNVDLYVHGMVPATDLEAKDNLT